MSICPPVSCKTETIDKRLFINTVKLSSNDIPFKVKIKVTKCEVKDREPIYRYKCDENAIDVKIKKLLESEIAIPDVEISKTNIVDYPNFIGNL